MMLPFIESYGISDIGLHRDNNEDAWAKLEEGYLYVLADGIAGKPAGEIAAKEAVLHICDFIERFLRDDPHPSIEVAQEILKKALLDANQWIRSLSKQYPNFHGMGTTICTILVIDQHLICAHVGDSRIYRFRHKLERLTHDHSRISMNNRQALTKALGISQRLEPTIHLTSFAPGDIVFLSTDGLHGSVHDDVMEKVLKKTFNIREASMMLIEAAKKAGSQDNITIVMIKHAG